MRVFVAAGSSSVFSPPFTPRSSHQCSTVFGPTPFRCSWMSFVGVLGLEGLRELLRAIVIPIASSFGDVLLLEHVELHELVMVC